MSSSLILFDIDGTLVDVRGAGRRAFVRALELTWGVVDELHDVQFRGGTDLGVLHQLRARLPLADAHDRAFFRAMEQTLLQELRAQKPRVFAGVHATLQHFVDDDAVLGFVTGNAMRCAFVKVEEAGIDRRPFDVGGFGDEHPDRRVLARLAKERAEQVRGGPFERVLLIGDTPNDVDAARHIGATAVGVTTGSYDRQSLIACGADVVVDSLSELIPRAT
ncbi:MAG: HAD family hydrolase [Deltaproteobacteria bacterium]|nr:HAD family hydrolase [Deltaproteobacteria bacterium]